MRGKSIQSYLEQDKLKTLVGIKLYCSCFLISNLPAGRKKPPMPACQVIIAINVFYNVFYKLRL